MNYNDLYGYQKDGVQWLITPQTEFKRPHRLLADEPGLGKTAQAIVASQMVQAKKVLIVCLATIKETWEQELVNWDENTGDRSFIVWTGKDVIPRDAKYIIVSYELLHRNFILKQLQSIWFDVGIVDEAHKVKTGSAKVTRRILRKTGKRNPLISRCFHKWFLTGSFLENRMKETYTLLRTMCPELLGKYVEFKDFGDRYCDGPGADKSYSGSSNVAELRDAIAHKFMLRREFKDVHDILPLIEKNVYCKVDMPMITNWEGELVETDESNTHQMSLWRIVSEEKIPFSIKYIREKLQTCGKLVVFAYHVKVIQDIYDNLKDGYKPLKIHGGVTSRQKEIIKNQFINDPTANPLILQIDSAGTGVDGIQRVCNNVVFVEKVWSGGKDLQAIGRLLRLHQTKPVYADTIIGGGTICEGINYSVKNKKNIIWEFNNIEKQVLPTREKNKNMLESVLERIAVALEKLSEQGKSTPGAKPPSGQPSGSAGAPDVNPPKQSASKGKSTPATAKDSTPDKPVTAKPGRKKKLSHDDIVATAREVIESYEVEKEGKDRVNAIVKDVCGKGFKLREVPAENIDAVVEALQAELDDNQPEDEETEETNDDDFE